MRRPAQERFFLGMAILVGLAFGIAFPVAMWRVGSFHESQDLVTPYDYAYPETETYIAGYTTRTRQVMKAKGVFQTETTQEPIYATRYTGRTLHETRYNHTVGFPYTAWQGLIVGLLPAGLVVFVVGYAVFGQ